MIYCFWGINVWWFVWGCPDLHQEHVSRLMSSCLAAVLCRCCLIWPYSSGEFPPVSETLPAPHWENSLLTSSKLTSTSMRYETHPPLCIVTLSCLDFLETYLLLDMCLPENGNWYKPIHTCAKAALPSVTVRVVPGDQPKPVIGAGAPQFDCVMRLMSYKINDRNMTYIHSSKCLSLPIFVLLMSSDFNSILVFSRYSAFKHKDIKL